LPLKSPINFRFIVLDEETAHIAFDKSLPPNSVNASEAVNDSLKRKRPSEGEQYDSDDEYYNDEEELTHGPLARGREASSMDLFGSQEDGEEEDEENQRKKSRFEMRMEQVEKEIAGLEEEALGPKNWTLGGEVTSKKRPVNSLLEETLVRMRFHSLLL
jgi:U3 small nucleolar RNA-associated protein MPP10